MDNKSTDDKASQGRQLSIRKRTKSPQFTLESNSSEDKSLKTKFKKVGTFVLTFHNTIHSALYLKLLPKLRLHYEGFVANLKEEFPAWLSWKVIDILFYLVVGYLYQKYKWKLFRFMLEA